MSTCPGDARLLLALLKPLAPDARTELTNHLTECPRCNARFQALRSLGYSGSEGPPRAPSSPSCPSRERLEALVEPVDRRDDDEAVAAHVFTCEPCQRELERAMHAARVARHGTADTPPEGVSGSPLARRIALALVLAAAVALGLQLVAGC